MFRQKSGQGILFEWLGRNYDDDWIESLATKDAYFHFDESDGDSSYTNTIPTSTATSSSTH